MGDVTDITQTRARKELEDLMEVKYLCGSCNNSIFMIYNGVVQCIICDDLIKTENFNLLAGNDEDDDNRTST